MKNIIKKAKETNEALKNYLMNKNADINVCQRIYDYIQRIENLTDKEIKELDLFISNNLVDEVHLADIYTFNKDKKTIKKRFNRMKPYKLSKSNSRVYELRGNVNVLMYSKPNREIRVKVLRKTYAKGA